MTTNPTPDDGADSTPPVHDETEAAVSAQLRALSGSYPQLPTSLAQRLDRALDELPELSAPQSPAPVPPAKTPWWRRRFALASGLLAVVVVMGVGVGFALVAPPWANDQSNTSAADRETGEENQPLSKQRDEDSKDDVAPHGEAETGYKVTYSGRDYSQTDLTGAKGMSATGSKSQVAPELATLSNDSAVRDACLSEVTGQYGGSISSVDFGQYEGKPAMLAVVHIDSSSGVVAALGPDCRNGDSDQLGSAKF